MNETHKELTWVREIDASREAVFKAWTDPKLVSQWWGPKGVFTPVCEVDARPGGNLHIVMEAGEELGQAKGMQWPMDGKFEEVDEPSKIVFSSTQVNNNEPVFEHRTTVKLEDVNGKTKMTVHTLVTKIVSGMEYAIPGMEQGWNSQFDKLVEFMKKQA